jgi:hypothetical protein
MIAKFVAPSLERLRQFLIEPPPGVRDVEVRRKSRLLAILLPPPAYHERVFGLFDKLDPQSEGTGVGPALVKRIVEVHGGKIRVESEGLGKGAAFCLTLPPAR